MGTEHKLAADLLWQPDGHIGEAGLAMLADGEHALLDEGVLNHVDSCELCSARLGEAALMSLRVGEDLAFLEEQAQAQTMQVAAEALSRARYQTELPPPRNFKAIPVRAIGAALVLAVVGAAPSLISGVSQARGAIEGAARGLSLIGRALFEVARMGGAGAERAPVFVAFLSWFSAALLVALGFGVARVMSRKRLLEGEVG